MKLKLTKTSAAVLVFITDLIIFLLFTLPFKFALSTSEITNLRIASGITPVLGMIFGWPAAFGCATGNLICDLISGYGVAYSAIDSLLQIPFAMISYWLWRKLNPEKDFDLFRLNSVKKVLKFCLLLSINSMLTTNCMGILNHSFRVSELFSIDNIYIVLNCFDTALIFGAPLFIIGRYLQIKIEGARSGKGETFHFSLNERMILNTLTTGICLSGLVGGVVYFASKYAADDSVSTWGKIYLFETFALNAYLVLSIGFMRFTEKKISKPIEELAHIANNYYAAHSTDEQRQQMVEACKIYANDATEAGELARSYISMAQDLGNYIENLKNVMAEKERISAELTLASDIQAHMLPCIFPPFPDHDEFDIYAVMHPAKEVGGDFYDFFMIDENHLAVIVADVSGKGVPAALFMVIAKTLIKNYTQMGMPLSEVFHTVNHLLCDGNDAGLFVTAWMGVIELSSGVLTYANAGHNPPLLKKRDGEFEYLRQRTGFVLAGYDNMKYSQISQTISPGDRLFIYTDGVTEANNAKDELYGEDRLKDFLNSHQSLNAAETLKSVQDDIDKFSKGVAQADDITMMFVDFKGNGTKTEECVFEAKTQNIPTALEFIQDKLRAESCPPKTQSAICVAIEEAFSNVSNYAYPQGEGVVKISFSFAPKTRIATFIISDSGIEFDPLKKEDPDITQSADERSIGGLGIFIIKKTMDNTIYIRENGENKLIMTKKIERSSN